MESLGYADWRSADSDFWRQRGFEFRGQKSDGTILLQGPIAEIKTKIFRSGAVWIFAENIYLEPEQESERRRVSFRLEVKPDKFKFFYLDEHWEANERMDVEEGVDRIYTTSGSLAEINNFSYDHDNQCLVVEVDPAVMERFGLEKNAVGRFLRPDQRETEEQQLVLATKDCFYLNCGGFSVLFKTNE